MSQVKDRITRELKQKIENEGKIVDEGYLNVSGFLNHRLQPPILRKIGKSLAEEYKDDDISLILTAEAAGNVIAYNIASKLSKMKDKEINALYAKKGKPTTMTDDYVQRTIKSPTKGNKTTLFAIKDYLEGEKILIVDDFLFTGTTCQALTEMAKEARGKVVGYGFTIMKKSYGGYNKLKKEYGKPINSIVEIEKLDVEGNKIIFG